MSNLKQKISPKKSWDLENNQHIPIFIKSAEVEKISTKMGKKKITNPNLTLLKHQFWFLFTQFSLELLGN